MWLSWYIQNINGNSNLNENPDLNGNHKLNRNPNLNGNPNLNCNRNLNLNPKLTENYGDRNPIGLGSLNSNEKLIIFVLVTSRDLFTCDTHFKIL